MLDSVPGLYTNVASFDFRSLYPSIIRTFQVDPLGLWQPGENPVEGFDGAKFQRTGGILPELITHLHEERTKARDSGNATLSTALGSSYINDFPNRGRLQRVVVQADAPARMQPDDLLKLNASNAQGNPVPKESTEGIGHDLVNSYQLKASSYWETAVAHYPAICL